MNIRIRHEPDASVYGKAAADIGKFTQKEQLRREKWQKAMKIFDTNEQLRYLKEKYKIERLQDYLNNPGKFRSLVQAQPVGNIGYQPTYGAQVLPYSGTSSGPPVYPAYGGRP